jgi:hypothetical protein
MKALRFSLPVPTRFTSWVKLRCAKETEIELGSNSQALSVDPSHQSAKKRLEALNAQTANPIPHLNVNVQEFKAASQGQQQVPVGNQSKLASSCASSGTCPASFRCDGR